MRAPGATWDCSVGNGDLSEAEEKPAELCGGGGGAWEGCAVAMGCENVG